MRVAVINIIKNIVRKFKFKKRMEYLSSLYTISDVKLSFDFK